MRRTVLVLLLVAYAVAVVTVTIFPLDPHTADYWGDTPWWTMIHYIPGEVDAPSFVLNVVLFVPFGVLVPLVRTAADRVGRLLGHALAISLTIEIVQFVLDVTVGGRRTVDVNDLIANGLGALTGLAVLRLAVPDRGHRLTLSGAGTPR